MFIHQPILVLFNNTKMDIQYVEWTNQMIIFLEMRIWIYNTVVKYGPSEKNSVNISS